MFDIKDLQFALGSERSTALIILDQFEELLLSGTDQQDLSGLLQFLRYCLTAKDSPCCAVATVRSGFLPVIQQRAELVDWNEWTRLFRLDLLKSERLFDVVRRPAELVDVRFENDALINRIVDEAKTSDAMPLLAFTLKRLSGDGWMTESLAPIDFGLVTRIRG